jgi:ribosomal protein L40E
MTRDQALEELLGTTCKGCGGTKPSGMSHCRKCYFKLPKANRGALYRRIGQGYEAAYAESLEILRCQSDNAGASK